MAYSQSLDINPIENLWRILKIEPTKLNDLKAIYVEEWSKILADEYSKLIIVYKKKLQAVISNEGCAAMYLTG